MVPEFTELTEFSIRAYALEQAVRFHNGLESETSRLVPLPEHVVETADVFRKFLVSSAPDEPSTVAKCIA